MRMDVDVLVIGGGPVGCTVARFAALGGTHTLIVEKRSEIGSPVRCGEGIAPDIFDEIGITKDSRWVRNTVDGARFISPAGHMWVIEGEAVSEEVGLVIDRDKFDQVMALHALDEGAKLMLRTHIEELIVDGGKVTGARGKYMGQDIEIAAKVVIAADGYESVLAGQVGIDTRLESKDVETCLQYTLGGVVNQDRYCDFYFGNSVVPGGYIWIFPKSASEVNVGLGLLLSKVEKKGAVKEYLDGFIKDHPVLSKGSAISMVAGGVSVSMPIKTTVADGFIVVGDAARMVDPLSGGGLANGMLAAKIAGEVAAKAVKSGNVSAETLAEYDTSWRKRLEEKMYRNYLTKELLLKQSDETVDKVIETLGNTKMENVGTFEIIQAIAEKHPDVVKEIEKFFI